jgi:eukaryotic-like serine/threonine-protein kinase
MIRSDGYIKVLDFGLAKLTENELSPAAAETNPGVVMGTPRYMSPEQARGLDVDLRTDIFSLGTVIYELVTGKLPFEGETTSDVIAALIKDEPESMRTSVPELPVEFEQVVSKALAKDRGQRYQTIAEFLTDLQRLGDQIKLNALDRTSPDGSRSSLKESGNQTTTPATFRRTDPEAQQQTKRFKKSTFLKWTFPVTVVLMLFVAIAVVLSLNRRSMPSTLTLTQAQRQLTHRDGFISASRFTPDGRGIVYSAGFDGKPVELFFTDVDGSASRPAGIQSAALKSVSRSGKIAVLFDFELNWSDGYNGTLAILSPDGGKPEIIGDGIHDAAFAPDDSFAIIRSTLGEQQLEYPAGQVLHKSEGWMSYPRFSPQGDKIAFFEHPIGDASGSIVVFDLTSKEKINIERDWKFLKGLAWNPSNNEIWFGGGKLYKHLSINAVSLSGQLRMNVYEVPGMGARVEDISDDGKILINQGTNHSTMIVVEGKSKSKSIDDSQFAWSTSADLSADGETLLYYESGYESSDPSVENTSYLRRLDGSENIRLGPGKALALSPDGKSALALQTKPKPQLVILSTSGNELKILPNRGMKEYHYGSFFPDGRHILFTGVEARENANIRSFVQDINTGDAHPLTEELTVALRVSPDGKSVITLQDRTYYIQPLDGTELTPIPGFEPGDEPIQWSDDGRSVYVIGAGDFATKIYRVSLTTGYRREWKEIDPPNKVGLVGLETNRGGSLITPDGKVCVYTYWILLQQLITKSLKLS